MLVLLLNKPSTLVAQNSLLELSIPELEVQAEIQDKNEILSTPVSATEPEMEPVVEKSDCKSLLAAIRAQDMTQVKALIKTTDVNCYDPNPDYDTVENDQFGRSLHRYHAHTPIVAAARLGNLAIAKLLVAAGADINKYHRDSAPMVEAAAGGFTDFVIFLVEKGADVNAQTHGQGSALGAAARHKHEDIVKYLRAAGAM